MVPVPSTAMWVKICGITNEEDALLAVALGADALGFNFAPGSPRQVTPDTVAEILHRLPPGVVTVGVFRDEVPERVVEMVNTLGLSGAQLNGREPISDVRWVRRRVPFVIQGFAAGDPAWPRWATGPSTSCSSMPTSPGRGRDSTGPSPMRCPPACGCCSPAVSTRATSAQAIKRVRPWGVDVCSGVETTPGRATRTPGSSGASSPRRARRARSSSAGG